MAKGVWLNTKLNIKIDTKGLNVSDISDGEATLSGFNAIFPEIERWYNSFNIPSLMQVIAETVDYIILENFNQGGRPQKWQQWSESWKKQRAKVNKDDGQILALSGNLRNSLAATAFTENSFKYGSNIEYAAIHQFGGGKNNIPARPYLVIPETDFVFISEAIMEFFGL